jgi:hypothetical protein
MSRRSPSSRSRRRSRSRGRWSSDRRSSGRQSPRSHRRQPTPNRSRSGRHQRSNQPGPPPVTLTPSSLFAPARVEVAALAALGRLQDRLASVEGAIARCSNLAGITATSLQSAVASAGATLPPSVPQAWQRGAPNVPVPAQHSSEDLGGAWQLRGQSWKNCAGAPICSHWAPQNGDYCRACRRAWHAAGGGKP